MVCAAGAKQAFQASFASRATEVGKGTNPGSWSRPVWMRASGSGSSTDPKADSARLGTTRLRGNGILSNGELLVLGCKSVQIYETKTDKRRMERSGERLSRMLPKR